MTEIKMTILSQQASLLKRPRSYRFGRWIQTPILEGRRNTNFL